MRELKRDALGRVEWMDGPDGPCVRRVACGGRVPGSRLVARVLLARERRALARLATACEDEPRLAGSLPVLLDRPDYVRAASLDGRAPRSGDVLLRSWIEGVPLWAAERLPQDFFERLEDLVHDVHAAGVCHNDLHKEPNLLVAPDGYPVLIDFQLASCHGTFDRTWRTRSAEDHRHVLKHRRRYRLATRDPDDPLPPALPKRRSLFARVWMKTGKKLYNLVTRRLFAYQDGEPRRPSSGPWPVWTDPVGARSSRPPGS